MNEGCVGEQKNSKGWEGENYIWKGMKVFHSPQSRIFLHIHMDNFSHAVFYVFASILNGSQGRMDFLLLLLFIIFFFFIFHTHSPAGADEKNQNHKGWNYYDVYIEMQQQNVFEA